MKPYCGLGRVVVASVILALPASAHAFELTGAWATDAAQCTKVFARKGRANQMAFRNFSGIYGKGFIVEPNRLRGKFENCLIKSRKDADQSVNIVVSCASGIMLSNVQFFLKIVDDNTVIRQFPGVEGMDVTYHRCKI